MSAFSNGDFESCEFQRVPAPEVKDECKRMVVGIDFGTSYSGIAYAHKFWSGKVRYGAPTSTDPLQTKVPTVFLELPGDKWEFGHTTEAKYNEILAETEAGAAPAAHLCKRFKMALNGKESGFDTLTAMSTSGKPHSWLWSRDDEVIHENDVLWVLTVPAIWNDFGKAFMRKAAFKAGMMETEHSDNLMLVLEPECAALAMHVSSAAFQLARASTRYIVLDCGGGLIDITVQEVMSSWPLSLKTVAAPSCKDCGGEQVNLEFKKFLQELLGPELSDEQGLPWECYAIYAQFEKVKIAFDPQSDPIRLQLLHFLDRKDQLIELAAVWNANHPEKPILCMPIQRNGFLTMSKEKMLSFFEPSLAVTVEGIKELLRGIPGVSHIIVSGGFGSSKVFMGRIRAEFNNRGGVKVVLPVPESVPKPQSDIAQGAVYFGMYDTIVASRVSPFTYGVAVRENGVDEVFSVFVRRGQELPHDHEVSLSCWPASDSATLPTWRIYRSDKLEPTTVEGEHLLGEVSYNCPLEPVRNSRQLTATFHFGGSELRVTFHDACGVVTKGQISIV